MYLLRYFKSLSKGEVPPVKARYELATTNDGGLSKGRLVTLHSQLKETVTLEELQEKWHNVGCTDTKLTEILRYLKLYNYYYLIIISL